MLRLSANISTLFGEWPMLERPAAAAAAGFAAIEIQFPYDVAAEDLAAACCMAGVEVVLHNLPRGSADAGDLGLACVEQRRDEFLVGLERAAAYAAALGCKRLNCLAGNVPIGETLPRCWDTLTENLRLAADRLGDAGIMLLVEVLNPVDFPAFLLTRSAHGDALIEAVAHPNLRLQYDVYHRRAAGEDWFDGLISRIDSIGHIQFSDYPGRHEPGTGELDMRRFFATIAALDYDGFTGAEYLPTSRTMDSFGWRDMI
jgi:hydroxypyruvate isomerase